MSISANLNLGHAVNTSKTGFDISRSTIIHDGLSLNLQLNPTSIPPVTKGLSVQQTLTAGAATIDLSTLLDDSGVAIGTGLKVQSCIIYNPSVDVITIGKGASSGYPLFGAVLLPIPPGATVEMYFSGQLIAIDGSHKNLDLSGTLVETLSMSFTFG